MKNAKKSKRKMEVLEDESKEEAEVLQAEELQEEQGKQEKEEIVIENTQELNHIGDGKKYSPPEVYLCVNCNKRLKAEDFFNTRCH